jgi:hypothetical protein
MSITIEKHSGIFVLRDDLLPGGTKSVLIKSIVDNEACEIDEFVYASPVYGGFQIALAAYCEAHGKKTTIFCAKRNKKHINTLKCIGLGANVVEVPYGYLTVVEKRARDYCLTRPNTKKIVFGAKDERNIQILSERAAQVFAQIGTPLDQIWCAIGSGTLVTSIARSVLKDTTKVYGVQVGAEFTPPPHLGINVIKYEKRFEQPSKYSASFPSMENYDLKAFEKCVQNTREKVEKGGQILFWNVYG